MPTATLTSKGQITLPKEVREHLHLGDGDRVEFDISPKGEVVVRPMTVSVKQLFGIVQRPGAVAPTIREMDEAVGRYLASEDERIRRGG